ncbi:amiloride-sensitive sodium channel subunit beta-like protein [Aphelenchoides avenae]|nr:amiloride-sensitive sodium channel subunit beta-like protein [Aphelenchus avenae]
MCFVLVGPLIATARRPWQKAAWTLVLVATTAVFVVQSGYLVQSYFEYLKTTKIRLIYEPQAPLPAVTFCNLNPYKKTMAHRSQDLTNLLAAYAYVNKMKEAQVAGGITAAAGTTMTSSTESHGRRNGRSIARKL